MQELLDAIDDDPDNDAPRIVYMDYLLERGDPRGEFLALQLADTDPLRQRALLDRHAGEWLGAAAPIIASTYRFRRGFLSIATLVGSPDRLPRELATVEELDGAIEPAAARPLRALRRVRTPMAASVVDSAVLDGWMSVFAAAPRFEHVRLVYRDVVYVELRRYGATPALAVNLEQYGTVNAGPWLRPIAERDGIGWRLELVSRWRRGHQDLADRIARLPNWEHVQIEGSL